MKSDQKPLQPMMPRNWQNDKLFLDDIIKSEIQKTVYLQMDPIVTEGTAIRKDQVDEMIKRTVGNVIPFISADYRKVLTHYIDAEKLDEYIISQLFFSLVVIIREKNKVVLEDVTSFKATNILNSMNLG